MRKDQYHLEAESRAHKLIADRQSAQKSAFFGLIHHSYPKNISERSMPIIELPSSVNILLNSNRFWLTVNGTEFTPSHLVKGFFVHKEGVWENEKTFSVFIADQKRKLAKKWGIFPIGVWNKQRFQFWDKTFTRSLFVNVASSLVTNYKIRGDMSLNEMERLFKEGVSTVSISDDYLRNISQIRPRKRVY